MAKRGTGNPMDQMKEMTDAQLKQFAELNRQKQALMGLSGQAFRESVPMLLQSMGIPIDAAAGLMGKFTKGTTIDPDVVQAGMRLQALNNERRAKHDQANVDKKIEEVKPPKEKKEEKDKVAHLHQAAEHMQKLTESQRIGGFMANSSTDQTRELVEKSNALLAQIEKDLRELAPSAGSAHFGG